MKDFIINIENYILEYCNKNNLNIVIDYIFNIKYYDNIDNFDILIFTINYDGFKYIYKLKTNNNNLLIYIKLRNNIIKQIVLNNKRDVKNAFEIMINDNKR